MTLVAGCYERFLFGYDFAEHEDGWKMQRNFTYPAHQGPVKCIAAAAQFVVSGGADDLLHVYDLLTGKDLGFLTNPGQGAITALQLFTPSTAQSPTHLLSGSADGTVSVWQAGGDWEAMKTMRGHRKDINSISVHNTGKLALSCSRDQQLRMWDLFKGRCTYHRKLDAEAGLVLFNASGQAYALACGSQVTVYSAEGDGDVMAILDHPRRVLTAAYQSDNMLFTGAEDGSVRGWDTRTSAVALAFSRAHSTRIRGLVLPLQAGAEQQDATMLATAASDGTIKLWDMRKASTLDQPEPLCQASTTARLTCLAYVQAVDVLQSMATQAKAALAGKRRPAQQQPQSTAPLASVAEVQYTKGAARLKHQAETGTPARRKVKTGAQSQGVVKRQADTTKTVQRNDKADAQLQGVVVDGVVDFLSEALLPKAAKHINKSKHSKESLRPFRTMKSRKPA